METKFDSALDRLKELVRSQKTAEFPGEDWPDPDVQNAAQRLRQYDQVVSMLVIQTIQGKPVTLDKIDNGQGLIADLQQLHTTKPVETQKFINRLLMYQERLVKMVKLVLEVQRERGK